MGAFGTGTTAAQKAAADEAARQAAIAKVAATGIGHGGLDADANKAAAAAAKEELAKFESAPAPPVKFGTPTYAQAAREAAVDAVKPAPAVAANSKLKTRRSGLGDISYTEE